MNRLGLKKRDTRFAQESEHVQLCVYVQLCYNRRQ